MRGESRSEDGATSLLSWGGGGGGVFMGAPRAPGTQGRRLRKNFLDPLSLSHTHTHTRAGVESRVAARALIYFSALKCF